MANTAREFAIELDRDFEEKVEGRLLEVVQKIGLETLARVVMKSPVDTGRFRGNWNVSINSADYSTSADVDPFGGATIARGQTPILGLPEPEAIWVSNGLPYANRLENGWSAQAPAGMVAVTVAEIETMFSRIQ
jgi:hypothetical protein